MPSQNYCIEISGLKSNFSFTATNPSNGTTNAGCTNYPNGYWLEQGVGNNAARRIMGWGQTGISTYGWMLTNSETQSCVIRNSLAPYNSNTPPSVFDLNSDFSTSSQPAYVTPGTCPTPNPSMVPGYMLTITIIYPGGNQSSESTGEMYPVARINGKPFYTNAEKCASVYYSDSDGRWLYTGRYGARGLTIPNGMVISVVGPSESDVFPLTGWNAYSNQANTSGYVSTTTTQATIPEVLVDYICLSGGGTYEPGIEGPYFSTDSSGGNYYRLDGTLGNMQGANCGPVLNKTGNILTLTANGFVWEGNLNSLSLEPVLSFGEQFGNRTNVSFYLNQCGPPTTPFPTLTLIQPYCVSGAGAWAFNGTYTKISANSGYPELWQKVDNPNMFIGLNLTTNMWYMFNSIAGNYYIHNNLENSLTPPLVGWHSISGSLQVPEISSGTCVTPTPTPTPTPTLSPCLAPANTNNGPFFFPTTKATNDIYSFAGRAWYWNNYAWHRYCMSTTSTLNAYFVSGAGSAEVNGKYIYNSSFSRWEKLSNQNIHLFYQAGYYPMWVIKNTNVILYHNYNLSSQTPPLTGWEIDSGTSPAPTIE